MRRRIALLLVALLAGSWCMSGAETNRLRVIATILPVYCIATNIGGELVEVRYLVGSGGDGHDYQLTPRDRSDLEKSRLLLMNGLGIEPWLEKVVASSPSAGRTLRVIDLSKGLESQLIPNAGGHARHHEDPAHAHGEMNPHVWLDPRLMGWVVTNALRAFQEVDPGNAVHYARNAAAYAERLRALDTLLAEGLRGWQGAAIVTYHDAFPYFARRYGLKVAGVIEEIPDVDPTPRHLTRLAAIMREQKVQAIFVEPRHSRRLATRLGRDLGVPVGTLDPLETGPASPYAYEDGMKRLLENLTATLK